MLLSWLIVGHLAGDFLLQTRWMAERKADQWLALLVHGTVYTAAVSLFALPAGGLSPAAIAIIFASHLLLDRRGFVGFWARRVTGSSDMPWLKVMLDQAWHLVILALVTLL